MKYCFNRKSQISSLIAICLLQSSVGAFESSPLLWDNVSLCVRDIYENKINVEIEARESKATGLTELKKLCVGIGKEKFDIPKKWVALLEGVLVRTIVLEAHPFPESEYKFGVEYCIRIDSNALPFQSDGGPDDAVRKRSWLWFTKQGFSRIEQKQMSEVKGEIGSDSKNDQAPLKK